MGLRAEQIIENVHEAERDIACFDSEAPTQARCEAELDAESETNAVPGRLTCNSNDTRAESSRAWPVFAARNGTTLRLRTEQPQKAHGVFPFQRTTVFARHDGASRSARTNASKTSRFSRNPQKKTLNRRQLKNRWISAVSDEKGLERRYLRVLFGAVATAAANVTNRMSEQLGDRLAAIEHRYRTTGWVVVVQVAG